MKAHALDLDAWLEGMEEYVTETRERYYALYYPVHPEELNVISSDEESGDIINISDDEVEVGDTSDQVVSVASQGEAGNASGSFGVAPSLGD